MKKIVSLLIWLGVALLGAFGYWTIATQRHEPVNSGFILIAALCTYAIGYRFYSKWIAASILALDDRRATPCEVHEDGKDFVKTNKWIVFGHHFAAISGPGPLVGPVLAAQFGYLPGTLWIIIGVVLGGAVQDFIILFASMRRDGRSLGQMVKEELNSVAGFIGVVAILAIMIILLAVLALVVVKALAESPWGVFTVGATIPIAIFMGVYLRALRVGKVMEVSAIGVILLLLAVWGGQLVHTSPTLHSAFLLKAEPLAWTIIVYGFFASVLPVWLLLAPRDYLSTFMKLGTISALAIGTLLVLPNLHMPAISKFVDGSGPVVPGKLFPFCFITIACGAISGFHTLISSGITPKIITREGYTRPVGYGAMCLESLVAIMAMIAACTLDPGVYLAMNMPIKDPAAAQVAVTASGLTQLTLDPASTTGRHFIETPVTVSPDTMQALATEMKEDSLYGRTGGAATLAVGMAVIFGKLTGGRWLDIWYHFAIMFEALFILTTLDAGTRVGRYLLQDAFKKVFPSFGDTKNFNAGVLASALVVAGWGFFLILGVRDPDGGVKALWPIFGIANQLLASIALCLATTVLIKMSLQRGKSPALAFVTLIPLAWLLTVTINASIIKVWDPNPKIGFLAGAKAAATKLAALEQSAQGLTGDALTAARQAMKPVATQHLNATVDAWVTGIFLVLVGILVLLSIYEWMRLLMRTKASILSETEPVYLPAGSISESNPLPAFGIAMLGFTLLKELSGEAAIDRAEVCACAQAEASGQEQQPAKYRRQNAFLTATEDRYRGVNRCC
ncbi:MAG TPA: carbon starvation CstA family protein [Chthoniobacter sp.]|nr:carbon starvation CstA family protein [Chthoniobacter sp.]